MLRPSALQVWPTQAGQLRGACTADEAGASEASTLLQMMEKTETTSVRNSRLQTDVALTPGPACCLAATTL